MKKLIVFASLLVTSLAAMAQGLLIQQGNVTYAYPFDEDAVMTMDGTTLTVNGYEFDLTQVDEIRGTSQLVVPQQVSVNYSGATATVMISGDLAGRVIPTIDGAHVSVTDNVVKETEEQEFPEVTYVLSGASGDGSFQQNGSYKATVSLAGVSLESTACPFEIVNGKRIDIVVAEGTQNTFKDGSNNFRKSAFWVKGHAEFSGAGVLNVTGTARHAYSSNEYTLLKKSFTGTLNVLSSAEDALHVDQYFEQRNGNVVLKNVGGDGLDVSATEEASDLNNGQVLISGGTFTVDVAADDTKGLKSETDMTLTGGRVTAFNSGNGTKGLSVGGNLLVQQDPEAASNVLPYVYVESTGDEYTDPVTKDTSKCRGIKVKGNFTFDGGTIERAATSTVKATKIISVDGTYTYKSGILKNCSISL